MASITPTSQTSTLDPYQGTLFEFNNVDSRIYMSRAINSLLNVYGTDVVIEGFKVASFSFAANALHVTFTNGIAVVDQTLIETPNAIITTAYDTTGLNLVNASISFFIHFRYLQQFAGNQFSIKSIFVDSAGSSLPVDVYDINTDRVCLAVFDFDATGTVVTQRQSNTYDPMQFRANSNTLNIDGGIVPVYPTSIIADTVSTVVREALA